MKQSLLGSLLFLSCFRIAAAPHYSGEPPSIKQPSQNITRVQNSMLNSQALCFVENKGQIVDQFGNRRKDIDFKVSVKGMEVFVGKGQIHYMLSHPGRVSKKIDLYRLDVRLLGADKNASMVSEGMQSYNEIDYLPQCKDGVVAHSFQKITYQNVYPNIDWVLYIRNNQLEYDFVVRPGGKTSDIRMAYSGATHLGIDKEKGLSAITPLGTIIENQPVSYTREAKVAVASHFVLHDKVVSFNVAPYEGTLVIDPNPSLNWGTYVDASIIATGTDTFGNVYICGERASTIATVGAYQYTNKGRNAFLVKFNAAGVRLWGTYWGGRGIEIGKGVACDPAGNIYMAGSSTSDSLSTSGCYQSINKGAIDAFLVKFDGSGHLLWSTYFGGTSGDQANNVACDGSGNVYLLGATASTTSIATPGSQQSTFGYGAHDVFLAKFSASGGLQWATYYGGAGDDFGYGIAADAPGNVYIFGTTTSFNGMTTPGCFLAVGSHTFIAKFNTLGQRQWGSYWVNGGVVAPGHMIACDPFGHVYVCGVTSNGFATAGSFQSSTPSQAAFLAQFNAAGSLQWGTYYGGVLSNATGITCDAVGNVYMTGNADPASTNIATAGTYQSAYGNMFLTKFDKTGHRIWGTYFGGSGPTPAGPCGLSCADTVSVYMAGSTGSPSNITTPGSFQPVMNMIPDGFLAKFASAPVIEVAIKEPLPDSELCVGGTSSLNYVVSHNFQPGNVFTAQLSDASGSFAHPVTVGTVAAVGAGTISCIIPLGTPVGTGYKIRIIASSPLDTSVVSVETVTINDLSAMTAGATSGCLGTTITLKADSLVAGQTYHWTGPNGLIQTGSTVVIPNSSYADSGNYLVVSTAGGCTKTDVVHVGIIPGPAKPIANSNSPVCAGDTILLKGSNITAGAGFYWNGPVSFHSLLLNPVLTSVPLSDSGLYILTANLDGCTQSDTILVMVTTPAVPTVTITTITSPLIPGYPATFQANVAKCPNPIYQWYRGASPLSGKTASTLTTTFVQNDNIKVVVHCSGCVNPNSATGIYTAPVGIISPTGTGTVVVYPNPVSHTLTIEQGEGTIARICNILGQVLMTQDLTNDKEVLDTSALPTGTFVLTLVNENGGRWSKVMVKE